MKSEFGLRKEMTLLQLVMANVGGMIGSGWLFGALGAAQDAGAASILAWVLGGVFMIFIALNYAELAGFKSESGAIVRYPQKSHGSFVSFLMGWATWLAYLTVPPLEAEGVVQYANSYWHGLYNTNSGQLTNLGLFISAVLVVVFFILNYYGVALFAKTNTFITLLKFIVPILTFVVLIVTSFHSGNITHDGGFMPFGMKGVFNAIASSGIVFAYQGFRQSIDLAGEAKNGKRDVPKSVIISFFIVMVIYVGLQTAFVGGLTGTDLAKGWTGINFSSPFAQLALSLNIGWLATIIFADAVVSPGGTGLIYTATTARILYALPKNGYLPKALARLHPKYRVPTVSLVVTMITGLLCLLPFPAWTLLIGLASSAPVLTYIMGPLSAVVLRQTHKDEQRMFRVKGIGLIAPIGFVVATLIIYWTGWPTTGRLMGFMLVGVLVYFYYYYKNKLPLSDLKAGIWLLVYLVFMLVMGAIGSFGGAKDIAFPWDTLFIAAVSLVFFYWGRASGKKRYLEGPETDAMAGELGGSENLGVTL